MIEYLSPPCSYLGTAVTNAAMLLPHLSNRCRSGRATRDVLLWNHSVAKGKTCYIGELPSLRRGHKKNIPPNDVIHIRRNTKSDKICHKQLIVILLYGFQSFHVLCRSTGSTVRVFSAAPLTLCGLRSEALCHKPEGRVFDPRWGLWDF